LVDNSLWLNGIEGTARLADQSARWPPWQERRQMHSNFTKTDLLHRACLRAAFCIRSLHEEKEGSDTRLLNPPIIPDALTVVGRSQAYVAPGRREHVIPRLVIIKRCHEMIEAQKSDEEIAAFIAAHLRIVLLTDEESARLDLKSKANLRQSMPADWTFGGDLFRRLETANIRWELDLENLSK
jgi:hypothetical protein